MGRMSEIWDGWMIMVERMRDLRAVEDGEAIETKNACVCAFE